MCATMCVISYDFYLCNHVNVCDARLVFVALLALLSRIGGLTAWPRRSNRLAPGQIFCPGQAV